MSSSEERNLETHSAFSSCFDFSCSNPTALLTEDEIKKQPKEHNFIDDFTEINHVIFEEPNLGLADFDSIIADCKISQNFQVRK